MSSTIDDATAQFLEAARDDLQRQLASIGAVDELSTKPGSAGVSLIARIRIGSRTTEAIGSGENLVVAYSDLRVQVAEPTLIASYRELVDS